MTLIVTTTTGGTTLPISMTVCAPAQAVTEDQLSAQLLPGSDLNVPFVAGALSAFLAHERAGVALYQVAAEHSVNPMLVPQYEKFGRDAVESIIVHEELVIRLGGDPQYVSPAARMTEQLDSKLLEAPVSLAGSVDLVTLETAFLEAVIVAAQKCQLNRQALADLGVAMPEGPARQAIAAAVARLEGPQDEHVRWATSTWLELALTNAQHPVAAEGMGLVEGAVAKIKDVLS